MESAKFSTLRVCKQSHIEYVLTSFKVICNSDFNPSANGYARSEAGVAILMQRAGNAKRIYATVAGTESKCDGFKDFGCNAESLSSQISLYEETLKKFNVNPLDISFVEVHGYATLVNGERVYNFDME